MKKKFLRKLRFEKILLIMKMKKIYKKATKKIIHIMK